jgi:hypothetical protein
VQPTARDLNVTFDRLLARFNTHRRLLPLNVYIVEMEFESISGSTYRAPYPLDIFRI